MRDVNNLFAKIDNLEYFPSIVLLRIFSSVNEIGLLNLAKNSTRFEYIVKLVLSERYTHQYLTIDFIKYNSLRNTIFFQLFGNDIRAFEVLDHWIVEGNRRITVASQLWVASLLKGMNKLEKLKLDLLYSENDFLLQEYVTPNINHLTLHVRNKLKHRSNGFVLSKFCNLKKIELIDFPCISFETLKGVINNNPGLESFEIINEFTYKCADTILDAYPFDELMIVFGSTPLKQLKKFTYIPLCYGPNGPPDILIRRQPEHVVDAFVNSLKHLESLALSFLALDYFTDAVELLYRLVPQCSNIKHLKLYQIFAIDTYNEIFETIGLFKRIESLVITMITLETHLYDSIVTLVENLPLLRHLHVGMYAREVDWSFILVVISKCLSLEKISINSEDLSCDFETLSNHQFFYDFKNCIKTRNVTIEVIFFDQIICTITKNQVVWRNKIVYWVGYNPSKSLSRTKLLDLADQPMTANSIDDERLFDQILKFLDLHSLQSLFRTNKKCSHLVDSYVSRHSKKQGTFIITNEFFTPFNSEYKRLDEFSKHVYSLRVNIVNHNVIELRNIIKKFHYLYKLHVYTSGFNQPTDVIVPQVKHLIFDGLTFHAYTEFYDLSISCPDLET